MFYILLPQHSYCNASLNSLYFTSRGFLVRKEQQLKEESSSDEDTSQRGAFNALSVDHKNRAPVERVDGSLPPQMARVSLTSDNASQQQSNVRKGLSVFQVRLFI